MKNKNTAPPNGSFMMMSRILLLISWTRCWCAHGGTPKKNGEAAKREGGARHKNSNEFENDVRPSSVSVSSAVPPGTLYTTHCFRAVFLEEWDVMTAPSVFCFLCIVTVHCMRDIPARSTNEDCQQRSVVRSGSLKRNNNQIAKRHSYHHTR